MKLWNHRFMVEQHVMQTSQIGILNRPRCSFWKLMKIEENCCKILKGSIDILGPALVYSELLYKKMGWVGKGHVLVNALIININCHISNYVVRIFFYLALSAFEIFETEFCGMSQVISASHVKFETINRGFDMWKYYFLFQSRLNQKRT